eukprot:scaffold90054_cov75-Phaeocystis_antarctica.AAC.8
MSPPAAPAPHAPRRPRAACARDAAHRACSSLRLAVPQKQQSSAWALPHAGRSTTSVEHARPSGRGASRQPVPQCVDRAALSPPWSRAGL